VLDGAGLSTDAAPIHVHADIELAGGPSEFKGLHDDHLQRFPHQIFVGVLLVDEDPALTGLEVHSGHGGLPSARAVKLIFRHIDYPRLNLHLFRRLGLVWMIGPRVNLELGYHLGTEPVLGKHPFDRSLDDLLRFALEHLSCSYTLDPARVA